MQLLTSVQVQEIYAKFQQDCQDGYLLNSYHPARARYTLPGTMNKNKTIAIFVNTSWNIYNFRLELLRRLQREGYRVVAIAPKDY